MKASDEPTGHDFVPCQRGDGCDVCHYVGSMGSDCRLMRAAHVRHAACDIPGDCDHTPSHEPPAEPKPDTLTRNAEGHASYREQWFRLPQPPAQPPPAPDPEPLVLATRQLVDELVLYLAGGDDPLDRCVGCGLPGVGAVRDALAAVRLALSKEP